MRTNKGIIGKIKRIEIDKVDKSLKWYVFDKQEPDINIIKEVYINKPYIVKHSKDIIDLIEVGDYVNGEKVVDFYLDYYGENNSKHRRYGVITKYSNRYGNPLYIKQEQIRTIVTHEQMSSIKYKV